jgi:transposase
VTEKFTRSDLQALPKHKLIDIILKLQDSIIRMEERILQLEGQSHKDSHNSHIPPSQSKPLCIKNLREDTGKKPGGQPGHPGKTLEMVDHPTHTITHRVTRCQRCGQDLSDAPISAYERRQIFDIPPIKLEVTEHLVEKKQCSCGHITMASFPETVNAPVQYGINTQTLVSTLAAHGYVTQKRLSETLAFLIDYRVNEATICAIQDKLHDKLAGFEEKSKKHLAQCNLIHNDESGISVEGEQHWVHVTSTEELTHYAIDPKRGNEATDRNGILPNFHGITVHDGWKSYFNYDQCQHALCNVHHLRELTFFEEEEKAPWARCFKDHLLYAKALVKKAREEGRDHLESKTLYDVERRYCEILEGALKGLPLPVRTGKRGKIKKTKQQNFIERLLTYKQAALRFIYDFRVPFSNNLAERDIRPIKLKDKISGTFRSFHGAECFARIRGYISTVRKNGRNVCEEIKNALCGRPYLLQKW